MRVLIVRIGALGDVLHALPAVAALRAARPDWTIDWVVDTRWRPLLAGDRTPVVNGTYAVDTRRWKKHPLAPATLSDFLKFRHLRPSYDLVVDMQGTLRSAAIGWLAGSSHLAGYSDPRESFAARLYSHRIPRQGIHVVDQAAALLSQATGVPLTPIPAALAVDYRTEELTDWRNDLPRPLALLCPGGGWAAKQWPAERFSQLALHLRDRGYSVLVNASSPTDTLALRVAAASRGAASIQPCSVAQLIALMRRTDLLIGHDSGPTHLAAALATPLIALFGPTDPARNGPWGPGQKVILRDPSSRTSYKHTSTPDPGLARIQLDDVLSALTQLQAQENKTQHPPDP
jgi:heptosyltransferase-1